MQEFFITIELGRGNSEQIRRKQGRQDLTVIWRLCCLNYDQRDVEMLAPTLDADATIKQTTKSNGRINVIVGRRTKPLLGILTSIKDADSGSVIGTMSRVLHRGARYFP